MAELAGKRADTFPVSRERVNRGLLVLLGAAVVFCGCMAYLEISPSEAVKGFPAFVRFFVIKFLPASFKNIRAYVPAVIDTVLFAVAATYLSTALSFLFGLLMSDKTNPITPLRLLCRGIISFLRNVPVLVWASILVYMFGVGEIVGLLALIIATLGFLSRSYAESISEIAGSHLEALQTAGASYGQVLVHGLIPEFLPSWINWTLFSFEINIRASAILGMVGAGGIGVLIQTNLKLFKYQEACAIILVVIIIVLLTEFMTNKIRRMIR
ncbi:phosphonate ABC transporter, permease protein PhnE [Eisenbergiella tayi]|uniref:Phosphate-import permease protein PhnE n=1 Tax=Eisenbergiella tayi TaxID=1432052 RepID=A0A1E3ARB7_9FIRM|nr:phosphonate ABC transporter, permease protein PhnE [Eisenbergiella tayi]ODM11273.1 Phosphate-import permease protein PhnE [Eisenbergiella tayi]OIZ62782.1 phosphonate ABC transporter, permease protein PhnE [Eisenbergiella tayi]